MDIAFLIIAGVIHFILGCLIIIRNRSSVQNIYFFVFAVTLGLWSISMALFSKASNPRLLFWIVESIYIFVSFSTIFFFLLSTVFVKNVFSQRVQKLLRYISVLLIILSCVLVIIPESLIRTIKIIDDIEKRIKILFDDEKRK